jgi:7-carboxy-7-deazaguanine synthase
VDFQTADSQAGGATVGEVRPSLDRLRVSEVYASRQGEGRLTGTPSVFIRLSGCNLRCWYCDTPHASWQPIGDWRSVSQVVDQCSEWPVRHAVITGGEPLLFPGLRQLHEMLRARGWHTTIETAGTVLQPLACDLMSVSPKLSASRPKETIGRWMELHDTRRWQPHVVAALIRAALDFQLKYVVDQPDEIDEVEQQLRGIAEAGWERDDRRVLIMPQGTSAEELDRRAAWLMPICGQRGWTYCDRAHIRWYGHTRGT